MSFNNSVFSGIYTPTLTAAANVAASTPSAIQWIRVGNIVTMGGQLNIQPSSAANCVIDMSIPVSSNFTAVNDAGGSFNCTTVNQHGGIYAETSADRLELRFLATNAGNLVFCFQAIYTVK